MMSSNLQSRVAVLACVIALSLVARADSLATDLDPTHFYSLREDLRRCASPMCGGFWVRRLNRKLTRCLDGSHQPECYVASLRRLPDGGLPDGRQLLVQGRIRPRVFEGAGTFGVFRVDSIWTAETDQDAVGRFVAIENNGIVCISSPCFSYDEFVLNRSIVRQLSGIDLADLELPEESSLLPWEVGEYLILSGYEEQRQEFEGLGLWFVASQIFKQVK